MGLCLFGVRSTEWILVCGVGVGGGSSLISMLHYSEKWKWLFSSLQGALLFFPPLILLLL